MRRIVATEGARLAHQLPGGGHPATCTTTVILATPPATQAAATRAARLTVREALAYL